MMNVHLKLSVISVILAIYVFVPHSSFAEDAAAQISTQAPVYYAGTNGGVSGYLEQTETGSDPFLIRWIVKISITDQPSRARLFLHSALPVEWDLSGLKTAGVENIFVAGNTQQKISGIGQNTNVITSVDERRLTLKFEAAADIAAREELFSIIETIVGEKPVSFAQVTPAYKLDLSGAAVPGFQDTGTKPLRPVIYASRAVYDLERTGEYNLVKSTFIYRSHTGGSENSGDCFATFVSTSSLEPISVGLDMKEVQNIREIYSQAMDALIDHQYKEALRLFEAVVNTDPGYRRAAKHISEIKEKLAETE